MELIWDTGRSLRLLRSWFHEQGALTYLVETQEHVRRAVVVLNGNGAGEIRVKMYADGSLPSNEFPAESYAWRPGDHIGHAIGPKKGGTNKIKALHELETHIDKHYGSQES